MRATNRRAVEWLLKNGYDYIWLKPHHDTRKKSKQEYYYTKQGNFFQTDLYNLFDGTCFDVKGALTLIQISTNQYHKEEPYLEFMKGKHGFNILLIKAVDLKKSGWTIKTKTINESLVVLLNT